MDRWLVRCTFAEQPIMSVDIYLHSAPETYWWRVLELCAPIVALLAWKLKKFVGIATNSIRKPCQRTYLRTKVTIMGCLRHASKSKPIWSTYPPSILEISAKILISQRVHGTMICATRANPFANITYRCRDKATTISFYSHSVYVWCACVEQVKPLSKRFTSTHMAPVPSIRCWFGADIVRWHFESERVHVYTVT